MLLPCCVGNNEISYLQLYRSVSSDYWIRNHYLVCDLICSQEREQNQLTDCQGHNHLAPWEQNHFFLASSFTGLEALHVTPALVLALSLVYFEKSIFTLVCIEKQIPGDSR